MIRTIAKGIAITGFLAATTAQADFMPENNLHLQDNLHSKSNVTQEQFEAIIDKGMEIYGPIVTAHGATLSIAKKWDDSTVNANAQQWFGTWMVNMYGGLARRDEVTADGFTLVLCHELGHHLAGFAFVSSWAANEGQADLFATQACAREFWGAETEINADAANRIPETPKRQCDAAWQTEADRNLCYRASLGGKSLADLLAALKEQTVSFDAVDENVVTSTNNSHPAAQCRLDTYVAGAVCVADFDRDLIPGKGLSNQNGEDAERQSATVSCSRAGQYTQGVRPACWFKPGI